MAIIIMLIINFVSIADEGKPATNSSSNFGQYANCEGHICQVYNEIKMYIRTTLLVDY